MSDDVARIAAELSDHLELDAMEEVEEAVAEDLPVRAAQLLRAGALPAARRHARTMEAVRVTTPRGEALREEAVAALDARATALEHYGAALERGLIEDLQLLDAIAEQRAAEAAVGALMDRLAEPPTPPD